MDTTEECSMCQRPTEEQLYWEERPYCDWCAFGLRVQVSAEFGAS
jgi:hypothetical protein